MRTNVVNTHLPFCWVDDATSTAGNQMVYEVVVVGEPKPKVNWLYNHKPISVSC